MTKNDIMIAAITPADIIDSEVDLVNRSVGIGDLVNGSVGIGDLVNGSVGIGDSIDPPQSRMPANREQ